ncbi:hypothetical protein V1J52_18265 [Streptomyces sp. TRM 70351]|uniref:hypothetical protein n=1 Tax=Streptomyces sp. TRM 70351 TaxID=3116552 RepID=UPI002E7B9B9D|nr:hypothetical protein [Streptomyces sp. TRM 70351]MEE1930105.1 hypothetical protein [Streptomyces sp. TRM 70351]
MTGTARRRHIAAGEVRADRAARAVRRLPVLVPVLALGPGAVLAGLLGWLFLPGPGLRIALMAGGLAVAGLSLAVLAVHRIAAGPFSVREAGQALREHGERDGARPAARRRLLAAGYATTTTGAVGWFAALVVLLPPGDTAIDPRLERIRQAGAVVTEVPVRSADHEESHYSSRKGQRGPRYAVTQTLTVELRAGDGRTASADIRTRSDRSRVPGDLVTVVYAPGAPGLGAYVGPDSRETLRAWPSNWQGYQDDLDRLLAGRSLSLRQWLFCGLPWVLLVGITARQAVAAGRRKAAAPPAWPLTVTYASLFWSAATLAVSALLLTDAVGGFGRLVTGLGGAACLFLAYAYRQPPHPGAAPDA